MATYKYGVIKPITLKCGVVVNYHHMAFIMEDYENDTFTARLNAYTDKASAIAGNAPLDIMMTDQINTQFTCNASLIDITVVDAETAVLNYIIANEAAFTGGKLG